MEKLPSDLQIMIGRKLSPIDVCSYISICSSLHRCGYDCIDERYHEELLLESSANGNTEFLRYLSNQSGIDWSVDNNEAICLASMNGHLNVVKFLSKQPGVDCAAKNNRAIVGASIYGYLDIVQFLSKQPGTDCTAKGNMAIFYAIRNGYPELAKFLLTQPGVVYQGYNYAGVQIL